MLVCSVIVCLTTSSRAIADPAIRDFAFSKATQAITAHTNVPAPEEPFEYKITSVPPIAFNGPSPVTGTITHENISTLSWQIAPGGVPAGTVVAVKLEVWNNTSGKKTERTLCIKVLGAAPSHGVSPEDIGSSFDDAGVCVPAISGGMLVILAVLMAGWSASLLRLRLFDSEVGLGSRIV